MFFNSILQLISPNKHNIWPFDDLCLLHLQKIYEQYMKKTDPMNHFAWKRPVSSGSAPVLASVRLRDEGKPHNLIKTCFARTSLAGCPILSFAEHLFMNQDYLPRVLGRHRGRAAGLEIRNSQSSQEEIPTYSHHSELAPFRCWVHKLQKGGDCFFKDYITTRIKLFYWSSCGI